MISTFSRPAARQTVGDELGGALDVGGVLGQSADAGDAQELLQLVQETVLVLFNVSIGGRRHIPL